ncbi:hypothetical protein [Arcticibacterium luteifluviistationis]|uniref:Lipocalin-like domain-containing protein n=1 Tax=Arcticibacterium luteifluviistationis TaxID=1784714 RepID=A0A2Z4GDF4_9BACT|nr:hypothetical protein [Arcticibacterium luteifluviistationis]AWV99147.1 hypothetical protein DJ013_13605 [Arcticibacterium luteifluviistationis]
MKTILVLFLSLGFVNSCTKENIANNTNLDLEGKWLLESASCFCYFDEDLDFSEHTIDFDSSSQKLTITNPESTFFISQAGTFSYTIKDNLITIEGDNGYFYELKDSKLILTRDDNPLIADDELTLIYYKN